jgi:hypothetical protein
MKQRILDLWYGRVPLGRIFWEYAILFGTLVNLITTFAALAAFAKGAPVAISILIFLLPAPYNLLMVVGVWRSAANYRGRPMWATLARALIIVWAAVATLA